MKLWELKGAIEDAIDALQYASNKAEEYADECDRQWKEMNDLHAIINSYFCLMGNIIKPEIAKAIKDEGDELDRLAEQADAQSH